MRHEAVRNGVKRVHIVNVQDIDTVTWGIIKGLWQEPNRPPKNVLFWGLDDAQAMLDRAKLAFDALEAAHRSNNGS